MLEDHLFQHLQLLLASCSGRESKNFTHCMDNLQYWFVCEACPVQELSETTPDLKIYPTHLVLEILLYLFPEKEKF